jgi:hypothetical protein
VSDRRKTTGTFRYSPTLRGESTTRRDGGSTVWWVVIDCDPELGRLLRHYFQQSRFRTVTPQPPLWGTHVSVIRGEEPQDKARWKARDGVRVELEYEFRVEETRGYLWVPVWCPQANGLRAELGLTPEPMPGLHLTFGNLLGEG